MNTPRLAVLMVAVCLVASHAAAQQGPSGPADDAPRVTFLSRSALNLGAEHLTSDDPRFVWDTHFGGNLDFIDYGVGRLTFAANYQAILGEEFRAFDPTQGNYELEGALSARMRPVEVAGVFYHQSRHLSDRAKRQPVDWNMVGVRVSAARRAGAMSVTASADMRGVVQHSFVDYRWELHPQARLDYAVKSTLGVLAVGQVRWLGTDGSLARGTQTGARAEGGVRLSGKGAAVELFVAVERRIDPYPLQSGTDTWAGAGFRLLSR